MHRRLVAVMKGYGRDLPGWLLSDLTHFIKYLIAGREGRREVLESWLFVRCAAAVLCGGCTGALEVETRPAGACEYNEVTQVLQVNVEVHVKREESDDDVGELGHDDAATACLRACGCCGPSAGSAAGHGGCAVRTAVVHLALIAHRRSTYCSAF